MNSVRFRSQSGFRCLRALLLLLAPALLGASGPSEYDIKLVYLYNFTKFVTWPDTAFATADAPLTICVAGSLPDVSTWEHLEDRKARNRPIELRLLDRKQTQYDCHVLFITRSADASQIRMLLRNMPDTTLLVGETPDFARKEGVIGFVTDDRRRVRIEINLDRARQRQLNIRAQLLEIARKVYRDEESS